MDAERVAAIRAKHVLVPWNGREVCRCTFDSHRGDCEARPLLAALDRVTAERDEARSAVRVAWDLRPHRLGAIGEELRTALRERDEARATARGLEAALAITPDDCGRLMHESWAATKRAQGFHGPEITPYIGPSCPYVHEHCGSLVNGEPYRCSRFHPDLIPWDALPERQKDINRHAFDAVLTEIRQRAEASP